MNYTLDDIIKNQNFIPHNKTSQFEAFEIQNSYNGINNQNRIGWEFMQSPYYKKHQRVKHFIKFHEGKVGGELYGKSKSLWHIPQDGIQLLDEKVKDLKCVKFLDLEPYFKYLAWHISIELARSPNPITYGHFPSRWGYIRNFYLKADKPKFDYVCDNINIINEKLKEENFEWESLEMDWHKFLGFSWALIQCGLGKYALDVVNPLFELHNREHKKKKSAISFVMSALFQDYKLRIKGTLSWIKAFAHKQVGEMDEYYNTLNSYVEYYEEGGCVHYNVTNRVLEASILVFKQKPTQENRERCLRLFQHTCSLFMDEPTECVRERGLIIYDFAKTIFKEDYEKYNR